MRVNAIVSLRRQLHANPELAGHESETARTLVDFFRPLLPDEIIGGLGGHGLAITFSGQAPGPAILLRCELDALPIQETNDVSHRSRFDGVSHKCGHDGHMAILAAVGAALAKRRPARGRVILLFQPAEETGEGAAGVMRDSRFAEMRPDFCFALHNLPGYPLGEVILRAGTFACGSRGMCVRLTGKTAHAAQPESGISPAGAMCRIIDGLAGLQAGGSGETAFVTIAGARLGEKAFGTAPGHAAIWATLRAEKDETMRELVTLSERIVHEAAADAGITGSIEYEDVFPATVNALDAVEIVRASAAPLPVREMERPFRWSEDFGRFARVAPSALFGIGAGETVPDLHNPDYDFPDDLISIAAELYMRIIVRACESRGTSPEEKR
ncbi:MAG: amidohydrolase [Gemmatimonadetes bacterium]|nr:amidohydrolase [Gemmatimonadota bacterium]